jgi:hypothetical protein
MCQRAALTGECGSTLADNQPAPLRFVRDRETYNIRFAGIAIASPRLAAYARIYENSGCEARCEFSRQPRLSPLAPWRLPELSSGW